MNIKELTELLVKSSQRTNQSKFIPWWEDDFENCIYRYDILKEEVVQDANACLAECGEETLFAPAGSYGLTLFHLLVWHNFYDAVEQMLCDGRAGEEEVNVTDGKGHGLTSLMLACCRGNLAMARLLLEHGADASHSDERGMNAYHFLAYPRFEGLVNNYNCNIRSVEQRESIARLLNCDINQKDAEGFTPLVRLLSASNASNYSWALSGVLLEKGAETGYVDENGNTLLMMAVKNNHMTAAVQLMKKCPEMVNVENKDGVTPMRRAADFGNEGLCLALAEYGAVPAGTGRMDIARLSQMTGNAFCRVSDDERDGITLALYLTEKLIQQVDMDDDDELGYVENIMHNALISDRKYQVLDICRKAGLDFTIPIHFHGSVSCLRDECLGVGYGTGAIRKLVELGVDIDEAVIKGRTPANIIASLKKQTGFFQKEEIFFGEAAKFFSKESMEQIDNNGKAAVHIAAANGHTGMLEVMAEKGVDVNLTEDAPADAGVTPLHEACSYGHADIVKLLVAAGADDTIKNLKGETPAHFAVMKKKYGEELQPEQRAGLLNELKSLDIAREDGKTPLMLLQFLDINTTRKLLPVFLDRGVDVNHADNNGRTALMLNADNQCYKETIKELIRAGADVNMADNEGNTALHYALWYGGAEAARFMIKKGADYSKPNKRGETAMQMAAEKGYETVLDLMI